MNRKRLIIILSVALMLIVAVIVFVASFTMQPNQGTVTVSPQSQSISPSTDQQTNSIPVRSVEEKTTVISKSIDYLHDSATGLPTFSIIDSTSPLDGWYIVTIRMNNGAQDTKVIMHDNNGLKVVLGPASIFPSDVTGALPDKVREAVSP